MSAPTSQEDFRRLEARLAALEAREAATSLMSEYMVRCDVIDASEPDDRALAAESIGELFTVTAVWEGVGRSENEFRKLTGREQIVGMFRGTTPGERKFHENFHLLANARVQGDAGSVTGTFSLLCAVHLTSGQCYWRVARCKAKFKLVDGRWYIDHFAAETLATWPREPGARAAA